MGTRGFRWGLYGTVAGEDSKDWQDRFTEYCAQTGTTHKSAATVKLFKIGLEVWEQNRSSAQEIDNPYRATRQFLLDKIRDQKERDAFYHELYCNDPTQFATVCMEEFGPREGWQEWLTQHEAIPMDMTTRWSLRAEIFLSMMLRDGEEHDTAEMREAAEFQGLVSSEREWERLKQAAHRAGVSCPEKYGVWQMSPVENS